MDWLRPPRLSPLRAALEKALALLGALLVNPSLARLPAAVRP